MGTTIDAVAIATGGLRRRHSALRLADDAARAGLAQAGIGPDAVDVLINAGIYRDRILGEPALAALIQEDVGANPDATRGVGHGTFSFDVANGACGVLNALQLADGLLAAGTARVVLVVASDADPGHGMAPGFPFGATGGAALCRTHDATDGFLGFGWANFPQHAALFEAHVRFEHGRNKLVVSDHPDFAERAATCAAEVADKLLADHGLRAADLDTIVACPPANTFLEALADRLATPLARVAADTAQRPHSAALLVGLDALLREHQVARARTVLLIAAGAGITAGAALYRR